MLEVRLRRGGLGVIRFVQEFLFGDDRIVRTLNRLARRLDALDVEYAVTGDLACVIYGQASTMGHAEVLLTPDGVNKISRCLLGDGYVRAPGSKKAIVDQGNFDADLFRLDRRTPFRSRHASDLSQARRTGDRDEYDRLWNAVRDTPEEH